MSGVKTLPIAGNRGGAAEAQRPDGETGTEEADSRRTAQRSAPTPGRVVKLGEFAEGLEGVLVGLGLGAPESSVGAVGFGKEFVMGAFFDDVAVGEHDDLVGTADRG